MKCLLSIFVSVLAAAVAFADGAASVESVTVATKAPHNQEATFWYHVPAKYDAKRRSPYPVLVYFGGRNCKGKDEASGKLGWSDWADANGVFLVCPGFKDDNYWEPEKWSGQALLDAVCYGRGFLLKGNQPDEERGCRVVLEEFRSGKLGRITLESAPEAEA